MKNHRYYRLTALCLSALLFCTACGKSESAASDETGTVLSGGGTPVQAAIMRLVKTEGNVGVADDAGAEVYVIKDMGLYDGYEVDTESVSYAWINLDNVKLTKMDEESRIRIRKEDKSLDVLVEQGSLFFQVTEPLEEDESLTIRSSNTVVGIRGTSGWVSVDPDSHLELYLMEGTVEYTYQNPDTGTDDVTTATEGQKVTMAQNSDGTFRIDVDEFQEDEIPPFVNAEEAGGVITLQKGLGQEASETGMGSGSGEPGTGVPELIPMSGDHAMVWGDSNLETAMRRILGIAEGDIMLSDVWEMRTLSLSSSGISDVSALAELQNLTEVTLFGNQISDVTPLNGLTNLTWIDLGRNQISDISGLSSLTNLTWLNLNNNEISDVSGLSSLTNLTWLNLNGNRIADVSGLSSLVNLTGLTLWGNQISDVTPLSGLRNLTWLELGGNPVSDQSPLSPVSFVENLSF
ncbi:MAG: leucine-rich repeat domain-containing protein [Roseburia sp.]|nr:leucine-rich repeat domain-containing protein [Roseburia sp.]MCM1097346.1 leucine-rich repeat domain-containing protein [Ruminococcus flavefaciens]